MRIFIAVLPDRQAKDFLCGSLDRLRDAAGQGSFTSRDNLHLTLVFVGEIPAEMLDAVRDAMGGIVEAPFSINIGGLGRFRRDEGDVCWMGVEPSPALEALHRQLAENLARMGFVPKDRAFAPHLTLGRRVVLLPGVSWDRLAVTDSFPVPVGTVSLMQSERLEGKLVYTPLYTKILKK